MERVSIGIDISKCTKDPDTCPVVDQAIEAERFCAAMQDLDPEAGAARIVLGKFVTLCTNGTCMGRNPELVEQILRNRRTD